MPFSSQARYPQLATFVPSRPSLSENDPAPLYRYIPDALVSSLRSQTLRSIPLAGPFDLHPEQLNISWTQKLESRNSLNGNTASHIGSKHFETQGLECTKALRALVVICWVISILEVKWSCIQ